MMPLTLALPVVFVDVRHLAFEALDAAEEQVNGLSLLLHHASKVGVVGLQVNHVLARHVLSQRARGAQLQGHLGNGVLEPLDASLLGVVARDALQNRVRAGISSKWIQPCQHPSLRLAPLHLLFAQALLPQLFDDCNAPLHRARRANKGLDKLRLRHLMAHRLQLVVVVVLHVHQRQGAVGRGDVHRHPHKRIRLLLAELVPKHRSNATGQLHRVDGAAAVLVQRLEHHARRSNLHHEARVGGYCGHLLHHQL
mmetsp:Transcript_44102/g.82436  ORF Transcript_44102/g.82436 Transcript_44102/m.82436 type:complete len:253 (-) Transcript_44102:799-1557(-)